MVSKPRAPVLLAERRSLNTRVMCRFGVLAGRVGDGAQISQLGPPWPVSAWERLADGLSFVVEGERPRHASFADDHGGPPGRVVMWPVKAEVGWLTRAREHQPSLLDPGGEVADRWPGSGPGCDARYVLGAEDEGQVEAVTRAEPAAPGGGSVREQVDEGGSVHGDWFDGANGAGPELRFGLGGEPHIARLRRLACLGAAGRYEAGRVEVAEVMQGQTRHVRARRGVPGQARGAYPRASSTLAMVSFPSCEGCV
jgi:hypothetical protein